MDDMTVLPDPKLSPHYARYRSLWRRRQLAEAVFWGGAFVYLGAVIGRSAAGVPFSWFELLFAFAVMAPPTVVSIYLEFRARKEFFAAIDGLREHASSVRRPLSGWWEFEGIEPVGRWHSRNWPSDYLCDYSTYDRVRARYAFRPARFL